MMYFGFLPEKQDWNGILHYAMTTAKIRTGGLYNRKIVKKTFRQFLQCKKVVHESKLLKKSKNGQISFWIHFF